MGVYVTVLKRAVVSFMQDKCTTFAAAIAYNAIFSIFPLFVFILSVAGFFIHDAHQRQSIVDGLFKVMGQSVDKSALAKQINAFAGGRGALGLLGLVATAWSASGIFGSIRDGLNQVWSATKTRPMLQGKALDLAMVVGVGLLLALSLATTAILTAVQGFGSQIFGSTLGPGLHVLFALLYFIIPPAIAFLAFGITYWLVPHAEIRFKDVWLGALAAAVAFTLAQFALTIYFANFAHYDKVYGTLGAVVAFLFFVYITGNIILFGGEVAKEHIDLLAGVVPSEESAQPGPSQSFAQQVSGFVKGLFIDESPHHDTSMPYEPGREKQQRQSAPLVRDKHAQPAVNPGKRAEVQQQASQRQASAAQGGRGAQRQSSRQPESGQQRRERASAPTAEESRVELVRDPKDPRHVRLTSKGRSGNGRSGHP